MSDPSPQGNISSFPRSAASGQQPLPLEGGNGGSHPTDMSMLGERVAKIEGAIDGLKSSVDALRWVVTILAALIIGGFAFLGVQMTQANNRIAGVEGEVRA